MNLKEIYGYIYMFIILNLAKKILWEYSSKLSVCSLVALWHR